MDPYKVLDINSNATPEQIKKAYHKMARKYHPDRNKGDSECEDKFKEVNEAYFILSNGYSKKSGPDIDIDTIFSRFRGMDFTKISQKLYSEVKTFQRFFNEKHPDPNGCENQKQTMEDIVINARVDIRDIYYNLEKSFKIKRKVKCKDCMGLGTITNNIICSECNGERYVDQTVDLKIDPAKNHHIFFKRGDEHISKYTGNVVVNVIKRDNDNFIKIINNSTGENINPLYVDIINNYDILVQISKNNFKNSDTLTVTVLDQEKRKIKISEDSRIRVKVESIGLINPFKYMRGDLFIQLV
jgi:DnaJ-class molecular chaperone